MAEGDLRAYRLAAFALAHARLRAALADGVPPSRALRDATDALLGRYDLTWREWDALMESLADVVAAWQEAE